MSQKSDLMETGANALVSLMIAFGVPVLAFYLLGIEASGSKTTGLALMYFVASTAKTYGLRRLFRWMENRPRFACKFCGDTHPSYAARIAHETARHECV